MNIGFLTKWGSTIQWSTENHRFTGQFIGEELYAHSLCRELLQLEGVKTAQVYPPGCQPSTQLDVMIHLNDTQPGRFARKHVLYIQNFYTEGSEVILRQLQKAGFDGYAFFSPRLLTLHEQSGLKGIFLPLAADTTIFQPYAKNPKYAYDVAYVGNDIKGEDRTMKYIYPAIHYNFGLFGNWQPWWHNCPYKEILSKISQGSLAREQSAILYSSSKIILNCTGEDSIHWDAMNLRLFEALACKGFLLSDKVPSAQRDLKDCLVFTDGGDDLIQKIDYYLSRPKERKEIGENGYQYVIKHATVTARAQQLYQYIQEIM